MDREYIEIVERSIGYWLKKTADIADETLNRIDQDSERIHNAIAEGLKQEETVRLTADLLINTHLLSERRAYWDKWIQLIKIALSTDCLTAEQRAQLLNQIGFLYHLKNEFETAIQYLKQSESLAQSNGFWDLLVRVRANLCFSYKDLNQFNKAEAVGLAGLALLDTKPISLRFNAYIHNALGVLYTSTGQLNKAEAMLTTAIERFEMLESDINVAMNKQNLGVVYIGLNQFATALTLLEEAAEINKQLNNDIFLALVQQNLGRVYYELGQIDASVEACKSAYDMYIRVGSVYQKAIIAGNFTHLLIDLNRFSEASYYLDEYQKFMALRNEVVHLANAAGMLGLWHQKQGEIEQAKANYSRGLEIIVDAPQSAFKEDIESELNERAAQLSNN